MRLLLLLPLLLVAVLPAGLPAADLVLPFPVPADGGASWLGDPARGPVPDPKLAQPVPATTISWPVNQGSPLRDWGHFRLTKSAVQRCQPPKAGKDALQAARDLFQTSDWKDGSLVRVSLLRPDAAAVKPAGGWPLIIFCPGSGAVGKADLPSSDPAVQWGLPAVRKALPAVVLRIHPMQRTMAYGEDGSAQRLGSVQLLPAFTAALDAIDAVVAAEAIDPTRIAVYGFSMGGSTTWAMVHTRPGFFAAAAPGAGAPPSETAQIRATRQTALWMFMGNKDPWAGSGSYLWAYARLREAGHQKVRFWESQDTTHDENQVKIVPLMEWLHAGGRDPVAATTAP